MRILIVLFLIAVAGCGRAPGILTPEERRPLALAKGASDLKCEKSAMSARYLGERLFAVSGCGRSATYRVICKLTVSSCYLLGGPDDQPT